MIDIEQITLFFLIAVFILAEIYRARRSVRGVVISVENSSPQNFLGEIKTAIVKLNSGREITATLTSCSACLGKIDVGSEVKVFNSSNGYVIDPVWFRSRKQCALSGQLGGCR